MEILKRISEYAKETNYPFNCIVYKIGSNFPSAFYDVIINYMKQVNILSDQSERIEEFNIVFTKEKNAYFEFINNLKSRIIIIDNENFYDYLPLAKVIREYKLLEDIRALDNEKNQKIISTLPNEFINRFLKTTDSILSLENMLNELIEAITRYAEYCVKEREKHIEKLYFKEADPTRMGKRQTTTKQNSYERVNELIPFEEREKVLNSYPSEYEFNAEAINTNSTYKVKVYKVQNKKYKLVLEPKEANKYIKIVHIDSEKLSLTEAREIAINSLQLNREQITNAGNITRHNHTSIDEYKKLFDYILRKEDNELPYVTKKRIDEAENYKTR